MTDTRKIHPIGYVARQVGLSAHVIRAWEKRYGAVLPGRTSTGRRLYSESDIQHLQLLRQASSMGHRIAQLSELDADTLIEIVGSQFSGGAPADSPKPGIATPSKFLKASRAAVFDLDEQAFEATLNRAAATLTRPALFDEIIVPLVVEIGENWATGKLKIVNEHMASSVLLHFLRDMLSAFRPMPSMPKMIAATPVNHWHELGALIAAIIAAEAGWGVYYYGPNLPAEEIAAAALYKSASAIALSVVYLDADRHILREINRLCNFTEGLTIIVGGRGVQSYRAELKQMNVLHPLNFSEFRELIGSLV